MEDFVLSAARYMAVALIFAAAFFALLAGSSAINLYLRYIDRLPIERDEVQAIYRYSGNILLLAAMAGAMYYLPFFTALGLFLCGLLVYQIIRIQRLLKDLRRS